jgi:hypothetical protein
VKWLIEEVFGQEAGLIPGVAAAALATLLITPAHDRLRAWSAARFQHALQQMRHELPLAVGDRRETASLGELLDEVLARIGAGARTQRSAVLLRQHHTPVPAAVHGMAVADLEDWYSHRALDDHGQRLDCDRDDARFPLRIPLRADGADPPLIGWMLLGPRPDGSFYGRDEREALAEIADPVARAIRVVQLREAREQRVEAQEQRQERRIATLERKLTELAKRVPQGDSGAEPVARLTRNGRSKRGASDRPAEE